MNNLFSRVFLILTLVGLIPRLSAQESDTPIRGFLVVEPFETRVEFLLEVEPLIKALNLSPGADIEVATNRAQLENLASTWAEKYFAVTTEAGLLLHELTRLDFVRPDSELGIAVDERETIPLSEAKIGVVFSAKIPAPPQKVDLEWNFFTEEIQTAVVEFGANGNWSARILTPQENKISWENRDKSVTAPTLENLPVPNSRKPLRLPISVFPVLVGFGFVIAIARSKKGAPAWAGIGLIVCIIAAIFLRNTNRLELPNPFSKPELPTAESAENLTYALLRNIYKAFEYRTESDVYDALDRSVTGDLLEEIYLEIQASLQLENQGGARVRVYDIDLQQCELTGETGRAGFVADCQWITAGTVTHWGHTHERTNRYQAVLTINPGDRAWKLSELKLVNEERIDQKSKKNSG